jgi:catechol 2,3-dioxygenase-like lactoylglutathione lyase family enzyme
MQYLGLGQVAVLVPDLDAAVADFAEIFGMKFTIVENDDIKMRVAVSDGGLVFAAPIPGKEDDQPLRPHWNGDLTAIELRVDDLEEARRRLEAKGSKPVYYLDAPGGLTEYYMDKLHGVPLTIFQMDSDSWVDAIGEGLEDAANYTPRIDWMNK